MGVYIYGLEKETVKVVSAKPDGTDEILEVGVLQFLYKPGEISVIDGDVRRIVEPAIEGCKRDWRGRSRPKLAAIPKLDGDLAGVEVYRWNPRWMVARDDTFEARASGGFLVPTGRDTGPEYRLVPFVNLELRLKEAPVTVETVAGW